MSYYTLDDIKAILAAWGRWSAPYAPIGTEFPTENLLHIPTAHAPVRTRCELNVDDEFAQWLDHHIAALAQCGEWGIRTQKALMLRYQQGKTNERAFAAAMGMSRPAAKQELACAWGWAAAIINRQVA